MDNTLKIFKDYADQVLEEQAVAVKQGYGNDGSKATRLKIFNEHLDILKDKLHAKMADTLKHTPINTGKDKVVLEQKLATCIDKSLSAFLKRDFDI